MVDRPAINKIEAAILQLEAAVFLMLRRFPPEPVHTLIWASRTVLHDLQAVSPSEILDKIDAAAARLVRPEYIRQWRYERNRAANFLKHADKDPGAVLEGVDLAAINVIELAICILVVGEYQRKLPMKLAIGLAHVGFLSGKWFDFRGYCNDATGGQFAYDYYERMPSGERQRLMLAAFESLHGEP